MRPPTQDRTIGGRRPPPGHAEVPETSMSCRATRFGPALALSVGTISNPSRMEDIMAKKTTKATKKGVKIHDLTAKKLSRRAETAVKGGAVRKPGSLNTICME
jgi:hypothetical protein